MESPQGMIREAGPPFIERSCPDGSTEKVAAYFHAAKRGKSLAISDTAGPVGLDRLKGLIANADVLFENVKVGNC